MNDTQSALPQAAHQVLDYWIGKADRSAADAKGKGALWFGSSKDIDAEIKSRFESTMDAVKDGACDDWLQFPEGVLAQIITLDQFTRNLYRGTRRAFDSDPHALELCLALQQSGGLDTLGWMSRVFALMPMQHSEDLSIQNNSVALFESLAESCHTDHREILEGNADYARLHRDIVARFGRFPHRNRMLGRDSTEEEIAWLKDGAPTFGQG